MHCSNGNGTRNESDCTGLYSYMTGSHVTDASQPMRSVEQHVTDEGTEEELQSRMPPYVSVILLLFCCQLLLFCVGRLSI